MQQVIADRLQQVARTCLSLHPEPDRAPGGALPDVPSPCFGGVPWWPAGAPWPLCKHCTQPLAFLCQLRLDGGGHWRPGSYDLLSLFFCWQCHQADERGGSESGRAGSGSIERPSGDGCLIRLLRLGGQPLAPLSLPASLLLETGLIPCRITGEPRLDVPDWQDVADELAASTPQALETLHTCYLLARAAFARPIEATPHSQLGGYPHWLVESCWPTCRWCGGQMHLLAQVVAEEQARLDWGQGRRGYVFCCAEPCDPEALTLVLQGG